MKDFTDVFLAATNGLLSIAAAKKKIEKNKNLWPNKAKKEYMFLYVNYPDFRGVLKAIWI